MHCMLHIHVHFFFHCTLSETPLKEWAFSKHILSNHQKVRKKLQYNFKVRFWNDTYNIETDFSQCTLCHNLHVVWPHNPRLNFRDCSTQQASCVTLDGTPELWWFYEKLSFTPHDSHSIQRIHYLIHDCVIKSKVRFCRSQLAGPTASHWSLQIHIFHASQTFSRKSLKGVKNIFF